MLTRRKKGLAVHPNALRATQIPAQHFCWAPRCPNNLRVRVVVGAEGSEGQLGVASWEFSLRTHLHLSVDEFTTLLEASGIQIRHPLSPTLGAGTPGACGAAGAD